MRSKDGSLVHHVARVQRGHRLEQHDVSLLLGYGQMVDTVRDNDELAGVHANVTIAEAHEKRTLQDQKQLILSFVVMPDEIALELHELDVEIVDLARDVRGPIGGDF